MARINSRIGKVSISSVVPTGTSVSVKQYQFCSTHGYSHISKISISSVVPMGTLVLVK